MKHIEVQNHKRFVNTKLPNKIILLRYNLRQQFKAAVLNTVNYIYLCVVKTFHNVSNFKQLLQYDSPADDVVVSDCIDNY